MKRSILCAAALAGFFALPATGASALPIARPDLGVTPMVENVACVVRRVRTVRPNGRVVIRTIRDCGPRFGRPVRRVERCRVFRERIIRPNGRVVVRDVRRCR